MKRSVGVTIDGKKIRGRSGMTILEAARKAGIEIPTLCHDEKLKPSGNCRVCVVQVEGSRVLVGSCHTPIADGMVVYTRSARVLEARRTAVELLVVGHTGACVTDIQARECGLHRLASELEAGPPRFHVKTPRLYAPDAGPYVLRDMSRCILCRKCIRACSEIAGQDIYAVAHRGFASKVVVDTDVPLTREVCKDCGICIEYCPTSALMGPERARKKANLREKTKPKRLRPLPENGVRKGLPGLLAAAQRSEGSISERNLSAIAVETGLSVSDVYGVASFYSFLSTKPRGRNVIRVCKSLPCYLKDAPMIVDAVEKGIGIKPGQTTPDGGFSLELTNCIGACDAAPAMLINDTVYGNLTPGRISDILKSYGGR
jgi:NADH:ubiquinone oxidoreductase subunit E/Pyruvate/2-oxoacid:ferredoxin oxidoreductase delta subunit